MLKKLLLVCLMVMGVTVPVCAAGNLAGGWQTAEDPAITEEEMDIFSQAVGDDTAQEYEPLMLLSTQVVAGTNYCFLARTVSADAAPEYVYVYIYKDLSGNVEILDVQNIEFGTGQEVLQETNAFAEGSDTTEDEEEIFAAAGTSKESSEASEYDEIISRALDQLKIAWIEEARNSHGFIKKPVLYITNTRIIKIAQDPVNVQTDNQPVEGFEDVDFIVEFMLLSNYFGDSLLLDVGIYDSVIFYQDGRVEALKVNPLKMIRSKYSMTDFSGVIEEVINLEDAYSGEVLFGAKTAVRRGR